MKRRLRHLLRHGRQGSWTHRQRRAHAFDIVANGARGDMDFRFLRHIR